MKGGDIEHEFVNISLGSKFWMDLIYLSLSKHPTLSIVRKPDASKTEVFEIVAKVAFSQKTFITSWKAETLCLFAFCCFSPMLHMLKTINQKS